MDPFSENLERLPGAAAPQNRSLVGHAIASLAACRTDPESPVAIVPVCGVETRTLAAGKR